MENVTGVVQSPPATGTVEQQNPVQRRVEEQQQDNSTATAVVDRTEISAEGLQRSQQLTGAEEAQESPPQQTSGQNSNEDGAVPRFLDIRV